jgi:hypothetical protein
MLISEQLIISPMRCDLRRLKKEVIVLRFETVTSAQERLHCIEVNKRKL